MIILSDADYGSYEIIDAKTNNSILIQTDWDYPGIASTFGWIAKPGKKGCRHEYTDGTVDCPVCGRTATEFITEAGEWLDANLGAEAEDPGYFEV